MWVKSASLNDKFLGTLQKFMGKPSPSAATLTDLSGVRSFFETSPILGLLLQGQCVYAELMRSAASSLETNASLKGSSKAFAALLRSYEEQTKTRDARSIRESIGMDVLVVRSAIDTVLAVIEATVKATLGQTASLGAQTSDIVLTTKVGSQSIPINVDARSLSQEQMSNAVGLRAAEAVLKLGN
eukprot:2121608-Amphidinium_carterae.1